MFRAVHSSTADVEFSWCRFAVVFFGDAKTSQLLSSFSVVANKMRDNYIFGKVTDAAVIAHFGVEADSLVAFKTYDDK